MYSNISYVNTCTVHLVLLIITNTYTINITTVYITTVFLRVIYTFYIFRHLPLTIRQSTTDALLSYISSPNFSPLVVLVVCSPVEYTSDCCDIYFGHNCTFISPCSECCMLSSG